jgi:hypothetical protein
MKLMFNENDGGFHNFNDEDAEAASKAGWVDGEPMRKQLLDAKRNNPQAIAKPVEVATIPAQSEVKRSPGRPKRPSILNDGEI